MLGLLEEWVRWEGVHVVQRRAWIGGRGQLQKTKYWQDTSEFMVKETGETFLREQVRQLYKYARSSISLYLLAVVLMVREYNLNNKIFFSYQLKFLEWIVHSHRWSDYTGLKRCGKSCRLRWLNYLRPEIKRGNITPDEEELIIRLHKLLGNRYVLLSFIVFCHLGTQIHINIIEIFYFWQNCYSHKPNHENFTYS